MSLKKIAVLAGFCLLLLSLQAAPHSFLPLEQTQPDGTKISIYASGDEFHNWLHDEDNYTIMRNDEGWYVYAMPHGASITSSDLVVGIALPQERNLRPGLNLSGDEIRAKYDRNPSIRDYSNGRSPHTGQFNNLVIFIKFADDPDFAQPITTYDNMFNNDTANANSMKNYFAAASYQQLNVDSFFYPAPNGTTVVAYVDSQPRNYYRPLSAGNPIGYDVDDDEERMYREHTLLANCVAAVGPQIPTSLVIDGDDDGYVDNTCFIIQGSPDGWAELLWPHRWVLYGAEAFIHGKRVWDFNFQLETSLSGSGASVLSHEMFHSLGAPDLYRYYDNTISPVGAWDLMASNTNPPQHMSAWMKYRYGQWLPAPTMITQSGEYSLSPVATSSTNNILRLPSWRYGESFVLEYRSPDTLYDTTLPGYGLLVYRLDTREEGNAGGPPDELYIYRPGGINTTTNGNLSAAAFSFNSGRTEISEATSPNGFTGNNQPGGINVFDIGFTEDQITFKVKISNVQLTSPHGGETWFYGTNKTITWKAKSTSGSVKLEYSTDGGENWQIITASTLNNGSYTWQGLPYVDSSECHVKITLLSGGDSDSNYYPFQIISQLATPIPTSPSNGIENAPTDPILSWEEVMGADTYHLQLSTDPQFESYIINVLGHPDNTYQCSGLAPLTTHYWRVAAESEAGVSPFSTVQSFTTGQISELPDVPTQVYPANNASSLPLNPTLSWNASYLADHYHLQISTSPYFTAIFYEAEDIVDTEADVSGLHPFTSYYWRVRAGNAAGYSNFSVNRRFTTGNATANDENLNPGLVNQLQQNMPNPFNPSTTISFSLQDISSDVRLEIFNSRGQLVRKLFDGRPQSHQISLNWDGTDDRGRPAGTGIYLYKLSSPSYTEIRKMILLK